MVPVRRTCVLVLLAGFVPLTAGCGSNNKGKIEGKWKMVAVPDKSDAKMKDDLAKMTEAGVYMYWEFKPDGTLTVGIGSDKPELLDFIKAGAPGGKTAWDAKYKLLGGDGVEVYDLPKDLQAGGGGLFGKKDRGRAAVKITGDNMLMTDDQGTAQLTRMK